MKTSEDIVSIPYDKKQYVLFENEAERDPLCFDLFFKDGPFGLLILDPYFQITKVNKKFLQSLNFSASRILGRSFYSILEEEDALSLKSVLSNSSILGSPLFMNLSFINKEKRHLITQSYIKRFVNAKGEENYCILIFEKEFSPNSSQLQMRYERYQMIIETQEEERRSISSALHDSVAQLLYGIRLSLQHFIIEHGFQKDIMPAKKLLNEAIHQVRNFSMDLFPSVLDEFGLGAAVRSMANRFSFPGFKVTAAVQEECEQLTRSVKLAIYRIVQELLNNGMKHAMASHLQIRIWLKRKKVCIEVADNGQGFSIKIKDSFESGTGLRNIRDRIKIYNGNMQILEKDGFTKITIQLMVNR